ncbi:MAG: translation initiation factor IF-2 [Lachnospiraceae bacterium]|nr:translation initiation factor IF-2 [Lachnospiraceae bacterium]
MAKMKVHELAKELEIQSKDIISLLQGKGYEVKAAQSSIEDAEIELVKKEFGKKESEKKENVQAEPAEEPKQEKAEAPAAPKKKKSIIIVSNTHNSKMPAGQRPERPQGARPQGARPAAGVQGARPAAAGVRPQGAQSAVRPTGAKPQAQSQPRPKTEPQTQAAAQVQPTASAQVTTQTQAAAQPKNSQVQAAAQREQTAGRSNIQNAGSRPNHNAQNNGQNNSGRSENPRSDRGDNRNRGDFGTRNQNRTGANGQRSSEGGSRPYRGNGQNDRQGNNGGAGYGRGGAGNGRPERRDDRQGNQFRKPSGSKGFVPESPLKDAEKHRDEEKRRISQEKDKRSKKDHIYEEDENKVKGKSNKAGRFIKPEKKVEEKQEEQIKVITIPDSITIKELAEKMKMQPAAIIKKLFMQGQIVTVNQEVDFETAENIAIDFDIICEKEVKVDVIEELLKEDEEKEEDMEKRAPVICVMGHVDHGKTSLLDAIRKTNVTDREAGGITQHIGAYTVNIDGQSITFLDTPGHEAFTAMRMRGANSTDIAILVVAADDGVMPQTVEAINHAKAAGIEIIVAVNKIDKPSANIDRVKQELAEHELISVDWGGTTEFVPVSAKAGTGISDLLETILLTAEILELKANPNRRARGLVIEAELDKGRGPVATVLVQKGTLHVGDFVSAGASHGKVRAMIDDKGRRVKEAGPSTPVEILGLSDVPNAGEVIIAHESDKVAKSFAETYLAQHKEKMLEETKSKMSLDDLFSQIQEGNLKELNLIIKADVQGSVEAVKQSLMKLSNEEVVVKCIHGGVGAINESDVSLASASNAIIIGFNVRPDATAKAIAEREGVDVRLYKVIYQAIEDVEAAMKGMLDPIFEEKVIGHAEVRQIFRASAVGNIAGSYVLDGEFQRGCKVRISREGKQIYEGSLASLKRFKDDVKEVKAGFECGLVFEGFDQIQELDIVEAYIMVEVPR